MSEEINELDGIDDEFGLEPVEIPPLPHSWVSVFGGCTAFGFVMTAAVLSILQYVATRPYDLVGVSEQTAVSVEQFLMNNNISPTQVTKSTPIFYENTDAHYYQYDYSVQLPQHLRIDSLERFLGQYLAGMNLRLSDYFEGGEKRGVTISFGEYVLATVRLFAPASGSDYAELSAPPIESPDVVMASSTLPSNSLPRVTLPRVNKAVFPASSKSSAPVKEPLAEAVAEKPTTPVKSYKGWVPPNKRRAVPEQSTNAPDDIELARIPEPDDAGPVIEPPKAMPAKGSNGRLAIIVDDGGYGGSLTDTILALDPKLTLSILPNTPLGTKLAAVGYELGFEIMLHMPMENLDNTMVHPGQLNVVMSEDEIERWTRDALQQVPHATGINNHTGSKFTTDAKAMALFLDVIKDMDLYFVDSKTTQETRAFDTSKAFGIRSATRDLFLDHDNAVKEIRRRFKEIVSITKSKGQAIAICHFRPNTASVLGELLATLESEGIELVHASELMQ